MAAGDWSIEYYVEESARVPVREFLQELDEKTYVRFQASFEQLRIRNVRAREPLVRHLEGKLWELREESRTNIYRVIYALVPDRRILLLHGFQKKTQKTPRREIEVARGRLASFEAREGGDRR